MNFIDIDMLSFKSAFSFSFSSNCRNDARIMCMVKGMRTLILELVSLDELAVFLGHLSEHMVMFLPNIIFVVKNHV